MFEKGGFVLVTIIKMANCIPAVAEKDYYYDDYYDDEEEDDKEDDDEEDDDYYDADYYDADYDDDEEDDDDYDGDIVIVIDDLRKSAESGNLDVFKSQIEKKPDLINTIFRSEWSCLMYAAFNGHHEIVKFCLENSADPNYVTQKGKFIFK